jgi:hypothetical protein
MDRKAAIDDYAAIGAGLKQLLKDKEAKPRCPRHDGGACMTPCVEMSDCFMAAARAAGILEAETEDMA